MVKRRGYMIHIVKKVSASIASRARFVLAFFSFLSCLALDSDIRNKLFMYWRQKKIFNKKLKIYKETRERVELLTYKLKTAHEILYENAFTFHWKNYSNELSKIRNERLDRFLKQRYLRPFTKKNELNKKTKKFLY